MNKSSLIKEVELFLDDKPSVFALRDKAKKALVQRGFPDTKTEEFKYTDVKEIVKGEFDVSLTDESCSKGCCCDKKNDEFFIELGFCGGRLHLEEHNLPYGIRVVSLLETLYEDEYKQYIFNSFELEKHPFGALNGIYLEQGVCIEVDDNVVIEKPIKISYKHCHTNDIMLNIHNLIMLGKGAKLEVVENCLSDNDNRYFANLVNEIYLKEKSSLKHYKVQKESLKSYHVALNAVRVQKEANYLQFYLSDGAKISRNETLINMENEGANANVYSLYVAKKGCLTDITTNVNHKVCKTYSNQYVKAVLENGSKATFQGKVRIEKDAVKVVGNQLHKALYLSDDAELNCKPELEIYADDVKCSHGASCGEIDKEQLFYLMSRGIEKECATKMLIDAHLEEILSYIDNDEIKKLFTI